MLSAVLWILLSFAFLIHPGQTCEPYSIPGSAHHDKPDSIRGDEGTKIKISCKPKFSGGGNTICQANGQWTFVDCIPGHYISFKRPPPTKRKGSISFIHVTSPFVSTNPGVLFEDEFVTESYYLALNEAKAENIAVTPVFGLLPQDLHVPNSILHGVKCPLTNSRSRESRAANYSLPFFSDLITCGLRHGPKPNPTNNNPNDEHPALIDNGDKIFLSNMVDKIQGKKNNEDYFKSGKIDYGVYFIYTNYDLILDPKFYVVLRDYIFEDYPKPTMATFTHKTVMVTYTISLSLSLSLSPSRVIRAIKGTKIRVIKSVCNVYQ